MKYIETKRLRVHPLSLPQLKLFLESPEVLAQSMGLEPVPLKVDPEFWAHVPDAIERICLPKVRENPKDFTWYTHWVIELSSANRLVGGIGFSGLSDGNGEVMIGYYVDDDYAGKGIASEATNGLVEWAFQNAGIQAVIADTLIDGKASQRVLEKAGFKFLKNTEEGNLRWRKSRQV